MTISEQTLSDQALAKYQYSNHLEPSVAGLNTTNPVHGFFPQGSISQSSWRETVELERKW